jgi:hypothetical protein
VSCALAELVETRVWCKRHTEQGASHEGVVAHMHSVSEFKTESVGACASRLDPKEFAFAHAHLLAPAASFGAILLAAQARTRRTCAFAACLVTSAHVATTALLPSLCG